MSNNYGPWATLINAGANPQLSAFWKRRLTMLVPASQTSPVLSRRNLLWLVMAGLLLIVLPTFHSTPAAADENQPTSDEKKPTMEEGKVGGVSGPVTVKKVEGIDVIVLKGRKKDIEAVTKIISDKKSAEVAKNEKKPAEAQAAERAYEATVEDYYIGHADIEAVYRWSCRWMQAERAERGDAAIQSHLDRMQTFYDKIKALHDFGGKGGEDANLAAVRYYVVEATEIKQTKTLPPDRNRKAADEKKPAAEGKLYFYTEPAADEKTDKKPADADQEHKKTGPRPWKLPNGTTMWEGSDSYGSPVNNEMYKLIAEKKYKFIKVFEDSQGNKQYVYSFTFSDGSRMNTNFSMPLENVSSWEDYQQKQEQQQKQRHEKINQAIVAGKFRLINVEVMQNHICLDVESDKKFKVQRLGYGTEREIAFPRTDYGEIPSSVKETSWKEHLQAIHDGKRELLESETVNSYTYEMTADDGTKVIFNYGGNEPLKKMPEKK